MMNIEPPPSRIYLLRHGKSGPAEPGGHDFDRSLDPQGYAETEVVADKAADRNYRPDVIISSTALRCRQTTDALRRAMGLTLEPMFVDGLYNGSASIYLSIIAGQTASRSVMLIGHNPTMELLLQSLVSGDSLQHSMPNGFPTAGLAVIDHAGTDGTVSGDWALTDFLRP